ncbi:hypothetical protein M2437_002883 [Methylorubrum pseudosasae]|nr:hypothetical protein [Methylorubrum pseudosasae]
MAALALRPRLPPAELVAGAAVPSTVLAMATSRWLLPVVLASPEVPSATVPETFGRLVAAFDCAWLTTDCNCFTSEVTVSMPLAAAWMVWMPLEMPSSRPDRAVERFERFWAVKKFTGLSRAELTFLPVASRPWFVAAKPAVSCRDSRFCRVAADSVMADDISGSFSARRGTSKREQSSGQQVYHLKTFRIEPSQSCLLASLLCLLPSRSVLSEF